MSNNRWVFLRGLTRGNIHWATFPEIFKKINPEAEIEFLEIPGNGLLSNLSTPVNIKKLLEILRGKSVFVENKQSFNICGISLGGMVALKWAELYPDDVTTVSIINSSLSQYSTLTQRLIPNNYEVLIKTLFLKDAYEQELNVLKITSNNFEKNKSIVGKFSDFLASHPVSKINFLRQLILAKNIRIDSIPLIPFKVISSKHDRLVNPICSEEIVIKLGGMPFIHPTAGHDLPLDEPEWLSEILVK